MDLPAVPELGADLPVKRIRAVFSGQEQRLTGVLPRHLRLKARFGYVELDLTRATFQPGVTEIDVRSFAGYVELRFPGDVRVESTGHALIGFFALHAPPGPVPADAPVVRVTGRAIAGYAECFIRQRELAAAPPAPERLLP